MNESHESMEEKLRNEETQPFAPGSAAASEPAPISSTDESAKKLADAEKQVDYYKDLLLRKAAEFDNFRKRAESESAAIMKYAKADVIQGLLPVIDDFERSLKLGRDRRDSEAFTKGVELIYQKLSKFLDSLGVKEINSLGKEFDVQYHDALLQVPRTDVPPHVVIEVVDKGYMLDDRVLRHAKVIVSTEPATNENPGNAPARTDAGTTTTKGN